MNLIHLLHEVCGRNPDKTAFVEQNKTTSYRQFCDEAGRIAVGLRETGIGPGDRVLVLMPLSVALYATLCAVWTLGAGAVMFDPSAGGEHIRRCLSELPVRLFVGSRKSLLLRWTSPPIRRIPLHRHVGALRGARGAPAEIAPAGADTPALVTFTSGSTAQPKAIVRTHGFLLRQREALVGCMPYRADDVDLAVLPVFTLVNLVEGITTVLPDDSLRDIAKVDAARLVAQIGRHGVNRITASPALLQRLCAHAAAREVMLSGLRSVHVGGGPVFLDILEQMAARIDPGAIEIVYGSTEAEPISTLRWTGVTEAQKEQMRTGGGLLVGRVVDSIRLLIIQNRAGAPLEARTPDELARMARPAGEAGEIIVAGEHVVQGYLRPEQNRENKIRVGGMIWHRTGDCGRLDGDGNLWLLGRAGQVIAHDGGEIYPFAVESAIRASHRCRAAVCTDAAGRPVLVVEQGPGADAAARQYADAFTRVLTVPRIPLDRRHASKVDYVALRRLVEK